MNSQKWEKLWRRCIQTLQFPSVIDNELHQIRSNLIRILFNSGRPVGRAEPSCLFASVRSLFFININDSIRKLNTSGDRNWKKVKAGDKIWKISSPALCLAGCVWSRVRSRLLIKNSVQLACQQHGFPLDKHGASTNWKVGIYFSK